VPLLKPVAKPKPKTKSGAAKPGSRKNEARLGLLKKASAKVAKAAAKLVKSAAKSPSKAASSKASKSAAKHPAHAAVRPAPAAPPAHPARSTHKASATPVLLRAPEKPRPRATKLPPVGEPLTKRELEQILTPAAGRGVADDACGERLIRAEDVVRYRDHARRDPVCPERCLAIGHDDIGSRSNTLNRDVDDASFGFTRQFHRQEAHPPRRVVRNLQADDIETDRALGMAGALHVPAVLVTRHRDRGRPDRGPVLEQAKTRVKTGLRAHADRACTQEDAHN